MDSVNVPLNLLVRQSFEGDEKSTIQIIEKFHPLIAKYSKQLNYDGANTDLVIALLELINCISNHATFSANNKEGALVNYISGSIRHKYIYLSKKHKKTHELVLDITEYFIDKTLFSNDSQAENILLYELLDNLPVLQRRVLSEKYLKQKSCMEISKELGVSRQSINKIKNQALDNMRILYSQSN